MIVFHLANIPLLSPAGPPWGRGWGWGSSVSIVLRTLDRPQKQQKNGEDTMKILIVDDHPLIREALHHVLSALDAKVHLLEAQDHQQALAVLDAHPDASLILLD